MSGAPGEGSGAGSGDPAGSDDDGRRRSTTEEASSEGADDDESGYPRDDYWREEARDSTAPDEVPEPAQGYSFESSEQKARAEDDAASRPRPEPDPAASEQGSDGGRDDARIVDERED